MKIDNNVALENEHPRVDIEKKVCGRAKYTADYYPQNMIYAKLIRFPYGLGKVESADTEAAMAVKGVLEVELYDEEAEYPFWPVGHIVAESEEAIGDAEEALNLKFERRRPKTDPLEDYEGAPEMDAEAEQRLNALYERGAAVVEGTWQTQVQTHSCLEPHGSMADHRGDSADIYASTQGTFAWLDGITEPAGLDASKVTVHNEFIGGGFGSKFGPGTEGTLAATVSKKFQRPCKVMLDRKEEHMDAGNRPGSIQYMKVAVDKSGKVLGGRIDCVSIIGHSRGGGGVTNPWQDHYDFGQIERTETAINLNFAKPRAFRAPGKPQAVFAMDGMMDEIAKALDLDPIDVKKANETSERRKKQFDIGAELIGWKNRKPDGSGEGIVKTGMGCAAALWPVWNTACGAECDIHRDGHVEIRSGVQDIGTGTYTFVTDLAAEELGIDRTRITTHLGNSKYPEGPGSGGSQVSRSVAPATRAALADAVAKLKAEVAKEWDVDAESVRFENGRFVGEDGEMSWDDACSTMGSQKISGSGRTTTGHEGDGTSDCVQFAEVEVDTETGIVKVKKIVAVHAAGIMGNRLTMENQICGGVIQGVSYALFENVHLDPHTGTMMNADFIGYKIAGSKDVPDIIPVLDVEESDTGVRPIGEPATIPTAGAIGNAIANAIGVRVYQLPITPQRVLEALDRKGGRA